MNRISSAGAAISLAVLALSARSAGAGELLTYTGNPLSLFAEAPYSTTDKITGTITLSTPLAADTMAVLSDVTSYSFSDGVHTLNQNNSNETVFFQTNSQDDIIEWSVIIRDDSSDSANEGGKDLFISVQNDPKSGSNPGDGQRPGDESFINIPDSVEAYNENPGVWTSQSIPSGVPEPSSWAMLLIGVGGMGLVLRNRRGMAAITA